VVEQIQRVDRFQGHPEILLAVGFKGDQGGKVVPAQVIE
jgi:hypothetical protein